MSKFILKNEGGILSTIHQDGDKIVLSRSEDLDPYLKHCADLRNLQGKGYNADKTYRHVAQVPFTAILLYEQLYGYNVLKGTLNGHKLSREENKKEKYKMLREFAAFRTSEGDL